MDETALQNVYDKTGGGVGIAVLTTENNATIPQGMVHWSFLLGPGGGEDISRPLPWGKTKRMALSRRRR